MITCMSEVAAPIMNGKSRSEMINSFDVRFSLPFFFLAVNGTLTFWIGVTVARIYCNRETREAVAMIWRAFFQTVDKYTHSLWTAANIPCRCLLAVGGLIIPFAYSTWGYSQTKEDIRGWKVDKQLWGCGCTNGCQFFWCVWTRRLLGAG